MNETRTGARVVVDTRFADLPNGLRQLEDRPS